MNPTYARLDARRVLRNPGVLTFVIVLPAAMYVIFGAIQSYSDADAGHGNVAAVVMASMASYGAISAATSLAASTALEQAHGWGRQLSLTPLVGARYVATKVATIMLVTLAPVVVVLAVGAGTGARIDGIRWLWTLLLCWVSCVPFALLGLALALLVRNEAAMSIGSFAILIFAFLGNMFVPLGGFMLKLARFTPLYGVNVIARYPISGNMEATAGPAVPVSMWWPVGNFVAWTIIFAGLAVIASRRRQER